MKYGKFLPENGTIGFVAPSFGCNIEPYRSAFENAQKVWTKEGYSLSLGPNVYEGCGCPGADWCNDTNRSRCRINNIR